MPTLAEVAESVLKRAQRQGSILPTEVRAELASAGLPEDQWKEAIVLIKSSLNYRRGRYYPIVPVSPRLHQQQEQQRVIARAIRTIIKEHKNKTKERERREESRIDFLQPVRVRTEDGREFRLLTRDLSTTGVRLLGTQRFLGQKIRLSLPQGPDEPELILAVRILWTCAVGDDLFENGGNFLEILTGEK